jgi:uncharacterized protein with HEPN domain
MPSKRAQKWFRDIVDAASRIETWVADIGDVSTVMADDMARSAIERQLLVISEAAIRLQRIDGDITQKLAPEIDWPGVRGMGNVIRHRYDDLDFELVADVITDKLKPLRSACEKALATLD